MSPPPCLRCETPMEKGFYVDFAHMQLLQSRWCAGDPQPGWLKTTEVKGAQAHAGIKVVAFRCPSCGYIETYAPPK